MEKHCFLKFSDGFSLLVASHSRPNTVPVMQACNIFPIYVDIQDSGLQYLSHYYASHCACPNNLSIGAEGISLGLQSI
jgi:hypothetical protein